MKRDSYFLLCLHCLVPTNGVAWYANFLDYIFSRILTPDEPLTLVTVMLFLDSDSDYMEEEDTKEEEEQEDDD